MDQGVWAMRMRCSEFVRTPCLVLALTLAPVAPLGSQVVTGLVYNDSTGAPVAGASVTLLTVDAIPLDSAKTDLAGRFELASRDPGPFHLSVAADGYEAWSTAVQLEEGQPTPVLVPLIPVPGVQVGRTPVNEPSEVVDVFGRVVERGTNVPVEGAEVTVVDRGRRTLTNYAGRFNLPDVDPGEARLRVEHLAFETEEASLDLVGGWAYQVQVELAETAIPLEGIEVTVRSRPFARLIQPAFERMDRGIGGHYLVDEDLSARGYPSVARSLQGLPSVRLRGGGNGPPVFRSNCRPALFIDGAIVHDAGELLWGMSTRDVELIEVYLGPATLPGEFANLGVRCAVAVWTKRGGLPYP